MAKIMILDDSEIVLKVLQAQLHSQGHSVVAHNRAEGALLLLLRDKPDLLLLDITMPDLQGPTLCRQSKKLQTTVLLHSGLEEDELARTTEKWGAAGAIPKSWTLARKMETVSDWINRSAVTVC